MKNQQWSVGGYPVNVWSKWLVGVCCLSLIVVVGCNSNTLGTVKVTGKLLLDDKPVEGAIVVFNPDNLAGRAASGRSDANGEFTLTTLEHGDGAMPGAYKVAVSKFEGEVDSSIPTDVDPNDSNSIDDVYAALDKSGAARKQSQAKNAIASRFANSAGSGLIAQVSESGENHFEFSVSSK